MRGCRFGLSFAVLLVSMAALAASAQAADPQGVSRGPNAQDLDRLVAAQGGRERSEQRARQRQSAEARRRAVPRAPVTVVRDVAKRSTSLGASTGA